MVSSTLSWGLTDGHKGHADQAPRDNPDGAFSWSTKLDQKYWYKYVSTAKTLPVTHE
jgi:hypothetical protein